MTVSARVVWAALTPRGRCNRLGMLIVAKCVVTIELLLFACLWIAGWTINEAAVDLAKVICLWLTFASFSKRLHDLGFSAWWLIGGAAGLGLWLLILSGVLAILGGPSALEPGSPLLTTAVVLVVLPVVALIVWLHITPGQSKDNAYGPVPASLGFSLP